MAGTGVSTLMRTVLSLVLTSIACLASAPAAIAQSGDRSPYDSNPECLDRRAPSDKCVIEDGPPPTQRYIRRQTVIVQPVPVRPAPAPAKPVDPPLRR